MRQFLYTVVSQVVVVAAYQTVYKKKLIIFFDFFGKLNVGGLSVKVVVKSINCVFVNVQTAVKKCRQRSVTKAVSFVGKLQCASQFLRQLTETGDPMAVSCKRF